MATLVEDVPNTQHGGDRGRRTVRDIRGYIVSLGPDWANASKQTSKSEESVTRLKSSLNVVLNPQSWSTYSVVVWTGLSLAHL